MLLVSVIALVGVLDVVLAAVPVRGPVAPVFARRIAEFIGGCPTRALLVDPADPCCAAATRGEASVSVAAEMAIARFMITAPGRYAFLNRITVPPTRSTASRARSAASSVSRCTEAALCHDLGRRGNYKIRDS